MFHPFFDPPYFLSFHDYAQAGPEAPAFDDSIPFYAGPTPEPVLAARELWSEHVKRLVTTPEGLPRAA
jgi:hypothetical protein